MDYHPVREFLRASREWARAESGMELLQHAARLLEVQAAIDSGCFVYRKRFLEPGMAPQSPQVFAPWGQLKRYGPWPDLLTTGMKDPDRFQAHFEGWGPLENFPSLLQDAWAPYDFARVGLWPLTSRERVVGLIVAARSGSEPAPSDEDTTLILDACAGQLSLALDLVMATRRAEVNSQHDWLTGLWNRRGLHNRLAAWIDAAEAKGQRAVVGIVDVDAFKTFNDMRGHPAGDDALRRVAAILVQSVRDTDLVVRWGGDEFVVLVATEDGAVDPTLSRLQAAVRSHAPDVSVSVGGARWGDDGQSWESCFAVADERLYQAKRRRVLPMSR